MSTVKSAIDSTADLARKVKVEIDTTSRNIQEVDYLLRKTFQHGGAESDSSSDASIDSDNDIGVDVHEYNESEMLVVKPSRVTTMANSAHRKQEEIEGKTSSQAREKFSCKTGSAKV